MARPLFSSYLSAAALAALLLSPHAGAQTRPKPDAERQSSGNAANLSAELMYRLLVGDIALQRGDPALAARAYYEAAKEVRDVRRARRATELALAARQRTLALDAATLWSDLDPTADRAKQVI